MRKADVDEIAIRLIEERWRGESMKDFERRFKGTLSRGGIERVRARFIYLSSKNNENKPRR